MLFAPPTTNIPQQHHNIPQPYHNNTTTIPQQYHNNTTHKIRSQIRLQQPYKVAATLFATLFSPKKIKVANKVAATLIKVAATLFATLFFCVVLLWYCVVLLCYVCVVFCDVFVVFLWSASKKMCSKTSSYVLDFRSKKLWSTFCGCNQLQTERPPQP